MSRTLSILFLLFVLVSPISFLKAQKEESNSTPKINYEISGGAGHYNYAPSAIRDQYGICYMFMCQNKDPFKIVDHIYLFKGIPAKDGYIWQPGTEVLAPSDMGWDNCHVCDPDVREFSLTYKGEKYSYIMTYLGVDQWDCNHNQIGLAFSKSIEGPWVKYDKNPLIGSTSKSTWGVGQSTSIVLDSTTVQIFYSHNGKLCSRLIKLDDLDKVKIGEEKIVPFLHANTYIAFSKKNIYAASEERINQSEEIPTWVGNHIRLSYRPLNDGLYSTKNDWKDIGYIGPQNSNFPRNHNPGLLTDTKGYMLNEDKIVVYFSVSVTGSDWLWSYDLYSATFNFEIKN